MEIYEIIFHVEGGPFVPSMKPVCLDFRSKPEVYVCVTLLHSCTHLLAQLASEISDHMCKSKFKAKSSDTKSDILPNMCDKVTEL